MTSVDDFTVPKAQHDARSRYIEVDGIRTHYLEAGEGPTVVLLHSGEFGASGEFSWEYVIPSLARHFRVLAPDWLGFGRTAKIHDFEGKRARMFDHLVRFVQVMAIDQADFVGNSMGGTFLLGLAAEHSRRLPIRKLVSIGGGGFAPDNEHRQTLLNYDGSLDGMVRMLAVIFEDPVWHRDMQYVRRRHAASLLPGAWESVAAARFRSPVSPPRQEFGQPDMVAYANIMAPALIIAGGRDRLRLPGYAEELAAKIANARCVVLPDEGHCPNIECPGEISRLIVDFLTGARVDVAGKTV